MNKSILFSLLFIIYLLSLPCNGDIIERKQLRDRSKMRHRQRQYDAFDDDDQDLEQISAAHVVVSKEGPPPSPQEYTISKLEKAVVCDARGDKTWAKWKEYDLDGVCARLQYYGEIEGQCETDCDLLCPQGFYEVAKEPCKGGGSNRYGGGGAGYGYYRQCVGRYKCTQTSYDYWVNLKWWQFLIWEVVIIILGCCFFGLAVGCCLRCRNHRSNNRGGNNNNNNNNNNNRGGGGGGSGGSGRGRGRGGNYDNNNNRDNNRRQGGY